MRSPKETYLLENALMKTEGVLSAIAGHVRKCAVGEVEKYIRSSELAEMNEHSTVFAGFKEDLK